MLNDEMVSKHFFILLKDQGSEPGIRIRDSKSCPEMGFLLSLSRMLTEMQMKLNNEPQVAIAVLDWCDQGKPAWSDPPNAIRLSTKERGLTEKAAGRMGLSQAMPINQPGVVIKMQFQKG